MPNSPSPPSGIICNFSLAMDLQSTALGKGDAGGSAYWLGCGRLCGGLNRSEDAGGEGEEGGDELEDATDYESDEAEGEKDEPDERVEDQREQGCGPADDEEDQEEEKLHGGGGLPFLVSVRGEGRGGSPELRGLDVGLRWQAAMGWGWGPPPGYFWA